MRKFILFALILLSLTFVSAINGDHRTKVIISPESKNLSSFSTISSSVPEVKINKFQYGNSYYADLTKDEIQKISGQGFKVREAKTFHVFLQDSVPLIRANDSWQLQVNSLNLTGAGQTVCIIDTGVNYSHADLGGCYGNNSVSSTCKVIGGWDFVNNDWDPMDSDDGDGTSALGHGTHVAGIVAANGSIKGVAPGARIISLKAMSSGNVGSEPNIVNAIEWCVNNASKFNISVISMSLGTLCYDDHGVWTGDCYKNSCDSADTDLADAINTAVAKNISVTVASGNEGNYSYISIPACISSAIPVAATNKDDTIASYSNRNSLVSLVAPGGNASNPIISTSVSGGYVGKYGTSMATPHVAGAIAILKQMMNLTSQYKVPKGTNSIESLLNSTGKLIYDSSSGLNFSRINIYSALLSMDNIAPNISLIYPRKNSVNSSLNQTFICNSSDWQLGNVSFYLWNSSSLVYNETRNVSGVSNQSIFNVSNLSNGSYKWACRAFDLKANNFLSLNFSLNIVEVLTLLNYPKNNEYTNSENVNFSCISQTSSGRVLKNVTFYLWNSSRLVYNETRNISGNDNTSIFNFTFSNENNYSWNCLTLNNNSISDFADSNNTITYDKTAPNLTLISPLPTDETSNSASKVFYFNVSDASNTSCNLFINDVLGGSENISDNQTNEFIGEDFSPGDYSWFINCTDLAGNYNSSGTESFTITALCSGCACTNSCGGGGGGSSGGNVNSVLNNSVVVSNIQTKNIYSPTYQQVSKGYIKELAKDDKIIFYDEKLTEHNLSIDSIDNFSVTLTISSNPITIKLGIGQSTKINLTSPNVYDFYISLDGILNGKANLTIQNINESIGESVAGSDKPKKGYLIPAIVISVIAVVIAVSLVFGLRRQKKRKIYHIHHHHETKKTKA